MNSQDQFIMLVTKITKHFQVRICEWLLSGVMVTWGVVAWNLPDAGWNLPTVSGLKRMADQHTWGAIICTLGIFRLYCLFRNGGWRPSPHFRAAGAFLSCFVWVQLTLGFLSSEIVSFGMAVYPWFLAADIYNAFRAAGDAAAVDERVREAAREREQLESAGPAQT